MVVDVSKLKVVPNREHSSEELRLLVKDEELISIELYWALGNDMYKNDTDIMTDGKNFYTVGHRGPKYFLYHLRGESLKPKKKFKGKYANYWGVNRWGVKESY